MNDQLLQECEQSFYRELYHMNHSDYSVVTDEITGKVCVQKKLKIYERAVYEYLKDHSHPNIPRIYALWEDDGEMTVIEELIRGELLYTLLERNALSDTEKKQILFQIGDALAFLHAAKPMIIHRDVKPENIIVDENWNAFLIDYNAAKIYHAEKTRDTVLLGTEGSAAPEQYGFGQSDARTDIYGMGALIRRMFPDDRRMLSIADKAMRLDPEQRYQTIGQLLEAIGRDELRRKPEKRKREDRKTRVNIPGFRTGRPWKMLLACAGYLFLLYCGFTLEVNDVKSTADLWLNRVFFLLTCFSMLDLFSDWTHFFRKFPWLRSDKMTVRVGGYVLCALAVVFFWVSLLLILENFM